MTHSASHPSIRLFPALVTGGAATITLALLILLLGGAQEFAGIVVKAWWQIIVIVCAAVILRFAIRNRSFVASVVSGVFVAATGFMVVLFWAISSI